MPLVPKGTVRKKHKTRVGEEPACFRGEVDDWQHTPRKEPSWLGAIPKGYAALNVLER